MDKDDGMGLDILKGLRSVLGIECKACGNINPSISRICEECKTPLEIDDDDDVSLSIIHREGMPGSAGQKKVPLEEAKYLLLLKDSVEKIKTGEMALEEYHGNVKTVLTVARVGAELFNTEVMQNKIEQLPEEQKQLALRTGALFNEYATGCSIMLQYDGSSNFTTAQRGLEMVEKALTEMDRIQDRALEIDASEREKLWAEESKFKGKKINSDNS